MKSFKSTWSSSQHKILIHFFFARPRASEADSNVYEYTVTNSEGVLSSAAFPWVAADL